MANKNAASEKVVTKYDRKMQKRKEEERKEAKRRYITKWVCIAVLACIILGLSLIHISEPTRPY